MESTVSKLVSKAVSRAGAGKTPPAKEGSTLAAHLKGDNSNQQFVTALARGITVLRCFTATRTELGTMEIAQMTGLPQPTVWRLCQTLQELGCIATTPYSGKLCIGMGILGLGFSALSSMDLGDLALPEMQTLADESRAAVSLFVAEPTEMLIIQRAQGNGALVPNLTNGSRIPLATSAAGWAYLAALSDEARAPIMRRLEPSYGDKWERTAQLIANACEEYSRIGFVMNAGFFRAEINSIGIAVCDKNGRPVYSLTCGAAATTLTLDRLRNDIGPQLMLFREKIQAALNVKAVAPTL
jgi:DNA-binding IclR family transcriptional regulator